MPKRIACINVFDDAWTLRRCIESLRRGCADAQIVVVDGAYADFPHPNGPCSTDGTVELAQQLADVVIKTDKAWSDEVVKRNAYFIGELGDTYFVIDSDEELVGQLPPIHDDDADIMLVRDALDATPSPIYRIYKHRHGIHYKGTHHSVWVGDQLRNKWPHELVPGCHILHHVADRGILQRSQYMWQGKMITRSEAKTIYYDKMAAKEREFRLTHGV